MTQPSPLCRACGRPILRTDRRGETRVYCSKRCRERRVSPLDRRLEERIVELLKQRARDASLCPSEVAREVGGETWRDLMEPVRRAGRRLAARGVVEFTQGARRVDPATVRGPIRIRRAPRR